MYRISYGLFYLLALLLMAMPTVLRRALFKSIGGLLFYLMPRYVRIVYANLDTAFNPPLPEHQKRTIAKGCFKNLLLEVLSIIETYFTPVELLKKRVTVEGKEKVALLKQSGKGIVFVTFHYNDLEVAAIGLAQVTRTVHIVQEVANPYLNAFIERSRGKHADTVPMRKALRHLAKQLKNGGDVSIVVDQSFNDDAAMEVEFFGQPTAHLTSASYLARKFDAPMVPVSLRIENGKEIFTIHDPIAFTKTEDEQADIRTLTQAQATFLETLIRRDPAPWFWCHRRWKRTLPHIYQRKK